MKLSASIMAHPDRAPYVDELTDALGRWVTVHWDQEGPPSGNADRVWRTARGAWLQHDPAADFHLLLQDDALVSHHLLTGLEQALEHVPPGAIILYEANYGFGWNDPRGWRVYFGTSANDVELKMRVYESMVNSLTQRGIRPALINVTYPTAPYYRMSQ